MARSSVARRAASGRGSTLLTGALGEQCVERRGEPMLLRPLVDGHSARDLTLAARESGTERVRAHRLDAVECAGRVALFGLEQSQCRVR